MGTFSGIEQPTAVPGTRNFRAGLNFPGLAPSLNRQYSNLFIFLFLFFYRTLNCVCAESWHFSHTSLVVSSRTKQTRTSYAILSKEDLHDHVTMVTLKGRNNSMLLHEKLYVSATNRTPLFRCRIVILILY